MKSILIIAALLAATIASAQTKAVLKNINGSTITESLTIGSGKTLTIASGATINATGATITGFGSGGGPTALDDLTDATITTVATNDFFVKGAGGWVNLTPTNARTALGLGTLATQSGTISDYLTTAAAASAYQPLDSDLTSIAALITTTAGRALLDDADASAQRATLGLSTLGGTDNVVPRTDGTGGSTLQSSLVTITDAGDVRAPNAGSFTISQAGTTPSTRTGSQLTVAGLAFNWNDSTGAGVLGSLQQPTGDATDPVWVLPVASGTLLLESGSGASLTALNGSNISSGTVAATRLGSGSSITTKYLRGDNTWQTISGGGDALTSSTLAQFAATTSAQLTGILSDESGTGVILTTTGSGASLTGITSGQISGLGTLATQSATITDYITSAAAAAAYQPLDSDLTSIAALITTTAGRSLLDDADASAQRTTLGLGTLATQSATITDYLTTASAASNYQPLDADLTDLADGSLTGTLVAAATTSARGSVELATDGETAASVAVQGSDARLVSATKVEIGIALSDETSDNTASSTVPKVTFRMPFAMTVSSLRCSLTKASTGAILIVDLHEAGATVMTTNKLSVDASETTSTTAATAHTLTDTALADDALIELFIDQVGATTDNTGEGVKVWIIGTR